MGARSLAADQNCALAFLAQCRDVADDLFGLAAIAGARGEGPGQGRVGAARRAIEIAEAENDGLRLLKPLAQGCLAES